MKTKSRAKKTTLCWVITISFCFLPAAISFAAKDTTPPATPVVTDDGSTTTSRTTLYAKWTASNDPQSGIKQYAYCIGPSKGIYNIRKWTPVGLNTEVTATGLELRHGKTYYFSVKAQNGAKLWSNSGYSDGIRVIRNNPPQISSITPVNASEFLSGASILITISASDPDSDLLQYQFSIAGTIKQAYSSSNIYTWQTSEADIGADQVLCQVKDSKGAVISQSLTYYLMNPTAEQILQNVADNYALIFDFQADMTLSSTLNGESFGEIEYCKYYFKAPNKEKTETYSDSTRATKTEINIINSSTMYLLDPINKLTQAVDLLTEANVSSAQYSSMDLYYNQVNFLNSHIVTKNNTESDFNNFVVAIDAIPKEPLNLYAKLELHIDYKKGLLSKISQYKNNELPQVMEIIETKQQTNGAWMATKCKKNPNSTAGDFIAFLNYDNIQANTGLTDFDFDPTKQY